MWAGGDERFNYFTGQYRRTTGVKQDDNLSLYLTNIQAPKNGYAYIYVSNESDEAVYFDNVNVALNRGRIIEEDHYYAYGLKIAAISSTKLGDINEGNLDNKNLYNDKELFDDADLDWYDYGFRNYDAQIGRFTQLDPLTWDYPELTNYQYASNDPIKNIDLDGLEGVDKLAGFAGHAANQLPDVIVTGAKAAKSASPIVGAFKAISKAVPGALGALSDLIPDNSTGDKIVGGLLGAGEAGRDALTGAYNMVRHPINTIGGALKLGTLDGQIDMAINITGSYLQSKADYGEDFTNSRFISYGITSVAIALVGTKGVGTAAEGTEVAANAGRLTSKVKYIGRLEDLKSIPRNQTLLDDLPNKWAHLSKQDAAKYLWRQNSSVLRKAIKDGYTILDASKHRLNSELAPTLLNPKRTVGQTFLGAERNLLNNKGLWP